MLKINFKLFFPQTFFFIYLGCKFWFLDSAFLSRFPQT